MNYLSSSAFFMFLQKHLSNEEIGNYRSFGSLKSYNYHTSSGHFDMKVKKHIFYSYPSQRMGPWFVSLFSSFLSFYMIRIRTKL